MASSPHIDHEMSTVRSWFESLRDRLIGAFEAIEADGAAPHRPERFARKAWDRPGGGGGEMSLIRGSVLEKAGVNISTVWGEFSQSLRDRIPGASEDPRFWASGISVVVHPRSPLVPAAHMNTRMIVTTRRWFGGGADMTPTYSCDADTDDFHAALQQACDSADLDFYPRFKSTCDEYFYLPHRDEARGVGGIFFDYHATEDKQADFAFVRSVGEAFLDVYPRIIRRHLHEPWTDEQRQALLVKRGRYAEFNLLYDRGTRFGLETGGNTEAILMSLPPEVKWP